MFGGALAPERGSTRAGWAAAELAGRTEELLGEAKKHNIDAEILEEPGDSSEGNKQ